MPSPANPIIEDIVDQHFEEAAFLWSQRDAAVTAVNYSLHDLVELDERVEAHIDGLRVAGDQGWALCAAGMAVDEPGSLFTASVLAFESGDAERIALVVDIGSQSRTAFRGVVSGLGWMDDKRFKAIIKGLVSNKSRSYRRFGIAACGIRRLDPRTYLDQAISSGDLFLKARALRTAGEIKRQDLLPLIKADLQHKNHACRFEAARSALLLGDRSALQTMSQFALAPSSFRIPAMHTALRILDTQAAQNLLRTLAKDPKAMRDVLIGAGIAGDPFYVPMLLQQMKIPAMARLAGATFSMITGVDLASEGLEGTWPEDFEAGPNDDPEDDNVAMDMDEDLPWPDVSLVKLWWEQNNGIFNAGTRYLAGSPISPEQCTNILRHGNQHQRQAATLELALGQTDAPCFNFRAPGRWQEESL